MRIENIRILPIDKATCDVAIGDDGWLDTEMLRAKKINGNWVIIKEPKTFTWFDRKARETKQVVPFVPRGRQWQAIVDKINVIYSK